MTPPAQAWDPLAETRDSSELQEGVSWGEVGGLGVSLGCDYPHVTWAPSLPGPHVLRGTAAARGCSKTGCMTQKKPWHVTDTG